MIDYRPLYELLAGGPLAGWEKVLPEQVEDRFSSARHGESLKWFDILGQFPDLRAASLVLDDDVVSLTSEQPLTADARGKIESLLKRLHPWRKGPFNLFGIHIDSEWRSGMKWRRLHHHLQPLKHRLVLDVGSGNGYYCWRILGAGAKLVVGIDPTLLSVIQFYAIRHFAGDYPAHVLPLGIEAMPQQLQAFDTVFSMGMLYHRRSPLDHLYELRDCLRPGGELVLETLVIEGDSGQTLVPQNRYAKMRNVWFIPSCETLTSWLRRCGFQNIRIIDVTTTTTIEQRTTKWMRFQSLADFLDPTNPNLTCEGLPAPRRAIFLANCPS